MSDEKKAADYVSEAATGAGGYVMGNEPPKPTPEILAAALVARRNSSYERSSSMYWQATPEELIAAYQAGERNFGLIQVRYADSYDENGRVLRPDLSGAILSDARFDRADFSFCDMQKAILRRCSLKKATFYAANLTGCVFERVNAEDTQFTETNLTGAFFGWANCTGTYFSGALCRETRFTGAILGRVSFNRADLFNVDLSGASIDSLYLQEADCIASVGPVGVEGRYIYAYWNDNAVRVILGCHESEWDHGMTAVYEKYGDVSLRRTIPYRPYFHEYRAAMEYLKYRIEAQVAARAPETLTPILDKESPDAPSDSD